MNQIDFESIDMVVRQYENLAGKGNCDNAGFDSIMNICNLAVRAEQVIGSSGQTRTESTWLNRRMEKLEQLVRENRKNVARQMYRGFIEKTRDLDLVSESCDVNLLKNKRDALDELCIAYTCLERIRTPRKVRKYLWAMERRAELTKEFENLRDTYQQGDWGVRDRSVLQKLIQCAERIAVGFRKIKFYEGGILAGIFKDKIKEDISKLESQATKVSPEKTAQLQVIYAGGYFSMHLHLLSVGYPNNDSYFKLYETLLGNNEEKGLIDRIRRLTYYVEQLSPSQNESDLKYIREIDYCVRESLLRGELANEVKNPAKKIIVRGFLDALSVYKTQCEKLYGSRLETQASLSDTSVSFATA